VVTGSEDTTARVWDADGRAIAVLKGHTGAVQRVAYSPDGTRVATVSDDTTARVWDAVSGKEIGVLRGHFKAARSVAFAADSNRIVTTSGDATARVWHFPWRSVADLIDTAVARVPRCLMRQERRELFLPDSSVPSWCYAMAKAPYRPLRFGVSHATINEARAKRLRLPAAEGVVINRIWRQMPADLAGLRVNDVVLAAEGAPVHDQKGFTAALDRVPAGGSIRLTVLRAGQRLEVELKPAF
jgi:S1-C subfamily serine protease